MKKVRPTLVYSTCSLRSSFISLCFLVITLTFTPLTLFSNSNWNFKGVLGVPLDEGSNPIRIGGNRTLVIVDSMSMQYSHSMFLELLDSQGHEITLVQADNDNLVLEEYDIPLYDNIILMAPKTDEMRQLTAQDFITFFNGGGNIFLIGSEKLSEYMRDIGAAFGFDFDRKKTKVLDYFQKLPVSHEANIVAKNNEAYTHVFGVSSFTSNKIVLGDFHGELNPIAYSGIGHTLDSDNNHVSKVLTGNPSSYSTVLSNGNPGKIENVGTEVNLLSTVQGRNGARVTATGSLSMFSNRFLLMKNEEIGKVVGNREFLVHFLPWAFGRRGILQATDIRHSRADQSAPEKLLGEKDFVDLPVSLFANPELNRESLVYRIKDDIQYNITISEYNADKGGWVPYIADDVQLEICMLDPYIRTFLTPSKETPGLFSAVFTAPDIHGVYKFRIMYRRPGYSPIAKNTAVSIRPFKHDEYERFIPMAFPYYSTTFCIMIAMFFFSSFVLLSK